VASNLIRRRWSKAQRGRPLAAQGARALAQDIETKQGTDMALSPSLVRLPETEALTVRAKQTAVRSDLAAQLNGENAMFRGPGGDEVRDSDLPARCFQQRELAAHVSRYLEPALT
jgi:hypothetical protein